MEIVLSGPLWLFLWISATNCLAASCERKILVPSTTSSLFVIIQETHLVEYSCRMPARMVLWQCCDIIYLSDCLNKYLYSLSFLAITSRLSFTALWDLIFSLSFMSSLGFSLPSGWRCQGQACCCWNHQSA